MTGEAVFDDGQKGVVKMLVGDVATTKSQLSNRDLNSLRVLLHKVTGPISEEYENTGKPKNHVWNDVKNLWAVLILARVVD